MTTVMYTTERQTDGQTERLRLMLKGAERGIIDSAVLLAAAKQK